MAARTKGSKNGKAKRDDFAGIPKAHHEAVRRRIQLAGVNVIINRHAAPKIPTPAAAYRALLHDQRRGRERERDEDNKRQHERFRVRAEDLREALVKLNHVEEFALAMAGGHVDLEPDALGHFMRLAIHDAGAKIEEVLCDFGIVDPARTLFADENRTPVPVVIQPAPEPAVAS